MVKFAINGLGRVGKMVLREYFLNRSFYNQSGLELGAVNSSASDNELRHSIKYDSTHGVLPFDVVAKHDELLIDNISITRFNNRDPEKINWQSADIDIIFECTGKFKDVSSASSYIRAGAKRVIISAPSPDAEKTIVYGVNHKILNSDDVIISAGSCTTNCLAPMAKIMDDAFTIEAGHISTIHSFTNDQRLLDGSHRDLRRARAASSSIIPTSTGAAKAIGKVLPRLEGKLDGVALRVPSPNVSLTDFTFITSAEITKDDVNQAVKKAIQDDAPLAEVMEYCEEPLVSTDYNGNKMSCVFDAIGTNVIPVENLNSAPKKKLVRIAGWYDNEYAFATRMLDIARYMSGLKS